VDAAVPRRALDDLFLARACEHGCNAAWTELRRAYRNRLLGLARHKASSSANAEDVVDDLLAELALPPASGATRTCCRSRTRRPPSLSWRTKPPRRSPTRWRARGRG
jgi:hypothetical protein